jgi:hypothetical protein
MQYYTIKEKTLWIHHTRWKQKQKKKRQGFEKKMYPPRKTLEGNRKAGRALGRAST